MKQKMHCISRNRYSLILYLIIGYQSLHIGHSWKKKSIEELHGILSCPFQLPADVPTLSEYIQTSKFAAFN
jgi:hypothetical protein